MKRERQWRKKQNGAETKTETEWIKPDRGVRERDRGARETEE